jgi:hypothetical protein
MWTMDDRFTMTLLYCPYSSPLSLSKLASSALDAQACCSPPAVKSYDIHTFTLSYSDSLITFQEPKWEVSRQKST